MTTRLGENIAREWAEDPLAGELGHALEVRARDRAGGTAMLADLADRGSSLAMMYLGHAQVSGGSADEITRGEAWLIRSAAQGSIERRLQLARHYQRQGAWGAAMSEWMVLAGRGYPPAMYWLARLLYRGDPGCRDVPQAIAWLRTAIAGGHLPSMALLSSIYRKEKMGFGRRVAAHWLCLAKLPAFVRLMWTYPASDRLRPYGTRSSA